MFNENVRPSETVTVTVYPHPVNPIPEIVTAHIQSVATDMLHHSGFGKCDFEDLCQELTLAVIKAFDRYDNTKASYYTYTQVIVGHARNIIYRKRIRRGLDVSNTNIDSISDDDPLMLDVNAVSPEVELENKEKAAIIRRIVNGLNPLQQKICNMIMDDVPMRKIISSCRLTPSQFYHRVWPEIQQAFKKNLKKGQK